MSVCTVEFFAVESNQGSTAQAVKSLVLLNNINVSDACFPI